MLGYECECRWQPNSGGPNEPAAFVGGATDSGEPMYVSRFHHKGDILPGYLLPSSKTSRSSYAGLECENESYEVLIQSHECEFTWLPAHHGAVVSGAVRGGQTRDGEILFIARVRHGNGWILGKVHGSHRCCYYSLDGREQKADSYEVLTCNLIKHGMPVEDDYYDEYEDYSSEESEEVQSESEE